MSKTIKTKSSFKQKFSNRSTSNNHVNKANNAAPPTSSHIKVSNNRSAQQNEPQSNDHAPSQQSQSPASTTVSATNETTSAPNGVIPNGHVSNNQTNQTNNANNNNNNNNINNSNNNLNNRKVVGKSKWVPLPIELPKSRKPREPRERNNNISSNKSRRDTDNDTDYSNSNETNEVKTHLEKPVNFHDIHFYTKKKNYKTNIQHHKHDYYISSGDWPPFHENFLLIGRLFYIMIVALCLSLASCIYIKICVISLKTISVQIFAK